MSPNQALMEQARNADPAEAWLILKAFQHPDPVLEWEWKVRSFLAALAAAEKALDEKKDLYAAQLLEEATAFEHGIEALERQRLLLLGKIPGADLQAVAEKLPSLDEELLLRAEASLKQGAGIRALQLLEAVHEQDPNRNLLQGRALMLEKAYAEAAQALKNAEEAFPAVVYPLLENCYRELGDFQRAYEYACRQR